MLLFMTQPLFTRPVSPLPTSPRLGLVCITVSDEVRFRAMTRKRLLSLAPREQRDHLRALYADNLQRLSRAVDYCTAHDIRLYRMPSKVFPFADEPLGRDLLDEFRQAMARIGLRFTRAGIRLVVHPDQFVVLNSDRPQVIQNSIQILTTHALILDRLEQARSPWSMMEIHGGKGDRLERLVEVIRDLPDAIRLRLALENDEHAVGPRDILNVCRRAGVPMVYDAHHHLIHAGLPDYDQPVIGEMVDAARATWPVPGWQLAHMSNGRESVSDRRHSDLIDAMPPAYARVPWIEVEAKHKEWAIRKLRDGWLDADVTFDPKEYQLAINPPKPQRKSQGKRKARPQPKEPTAAAS